LEVALFTVYKSVNTQNNRYYIGVHETDDPHDSYLGSGPIIRRAVKKYGSAAFRKEILFTFEGDEAFKLAYAKEAELVAEALKDPLCYNLQDGGKGDFKYINEHGLSDPGRAGRIAKLMGKGGRPKGVKYVSKPIENSELVCAYGCNQKARFLIGKEEKPCCSEKLRSCSGYMANRKPTKVTVAPEGLLCAYNGCGKPAKFLLGNKAIPCCSVSFYNCPGFGKNRKDLRDPELRQKMESTMLARYGVTNPVMNAELRVKLALAMTGKKRAPASQETRQKIGAKGKAAWARRKAMMTSNL
jgi:hypothetical protein